MDEKLVLRELSGMDEVPDLLDTWRNSVERRRDFISAADLDAVATALEALYSHKLQLKIAQIGEKIVGFAAWRDSQIELLWVSHADRQKGVGRILLEDILDANPGLSIRLDGQRVQAIEFFESCGFKAVTNAPEPVAERVLLRHE